jgi:hypothetical protein
MGVRWIGVFVATAGLAAACELFTNSASYRSYAGVCNACPAASGPLKRPECPPNVVPDDRDAGQPPPEQTYVYAWRTFSLGGDPQALSDPKYNVGYDQDCSTRADGGLPALCLGYPNPGTVVASPPWTPLPMGIDNSIGQRVQAPLVTFAQSLGVHIDVDGAVSGLLETGKAGEIVILENWNGTPNDADVTATFVGTSGTVGTPLWQGNDVWIANSAISIYPHFSAYIANGQLFVDTSSVGEDDLNVTLSDRQGLPVTFRLTGRLTVRAGSVTPDAMTLTTYGRWNLDDALAQVPNLVRLWAGSGSDGGDPIGTTLGQGLTDLLRAAADLPLAGESIAPPGRSLPRCAAISFAAQATAMRAYYVESK